MQRYTRHQLKEDKFAKAITDQVHWTVEHRNSLIIGAIVVVIIVGAAFGGWTYMRKQDDRASLALGKAMDTYTSPIRTPGQSVPPDAKSFNTSKERAEAARKEFQKVASEFGSTQNGKYAEYMAGVMSAEIGDNKAAEDSYKKVASEGDKNLSTLAKFALASLCASQDREADTVKYYREVIDANSSAVPKTIAQLALAAYFEPKKPGEAVKIYEEIQKGEEAERKANAPKDAKDSKTPVSAAKTPLEQAAEAKIAQLKAAAGATH